MRRIIAFVNVAFFLTIPALLHAQSELGIWRLNIAKSTTTAVQAKSRTFTIQAHEGGIMQQTEGVAGDGSPINFAYMAKYDGRDNPIQGTGPNGADSVALKRIDPNTTEVTFKKAGKVVLTVHRSISQDRKVMTDTTEGTSLDGKPTSGRVVYENRFP